MSPQQRRIQRGRSGGVPRRQRRRRSVKETLLVVGEGKETEPNYFHRLKREDAVAERFAVTVKKGRRGTRVQIVNGVIKYKNEYGKTYDETWCVMDVERLDTPVVRQDFEEACALARENDIQLCLSNPSLEVWFRAHFVRSSKHFRDCDAVIRELNRYWRDRFNGQAYDKADDGIYEKLRPFLDDAIHNAQDVRETDHRDKTDMVECNSSTEMYFLVRKLLH